MNYRYRILFTANNPYDPALELPVLSALKYLGYEVETCDSTLKPFGSRLLFRIGRRLFKTRSPYFLWNKLLRISTWFTQKKVLRAVRKFKPDIFLAIKAKEVEVGTINKLKDMGIVTVNWYMEGIWHQSVSILAPVYDHFFIMDEYSVSVLKDRGIKNVYFLPHGTRLDSVQTDISKELERIYDIAFVGTPVPIREKNFGTLSGFNLNLWGSPEWRNTQLRKFYRGQVFGKQLDDVYKQSKIVINCHPPDGNSTNLRDFESISNGALLISDYKPALAELFVENKEIIFYRDVKELPDLVSYYLKHADERSAIAKAGQSAVLARHTIRSRIGEMMETIRPFLKTPND